MSTKMLDVKRYLKTLLEAMPILADADVQITHGFPKDPRRTYVLVGDASMQRVEWVTNQSREEEFAVEVFFSTQKTRAEGVDAEQHLLDIAEAFEEALDADPGLGDLCVTSRFYPKQLGSRASESAVEARLETEVVAVCRP